jgi:hypothetical protein
MEGEVILCLGAMWRGSMSCRQRQVDDACGGTYADVHRRSRCVFLLCSYRQVEEEM